MFLKTKGLSISEFEELFLSVQVGMEYIQHVYKVSQLQREWSRQIYKNSLFSHCKVLIFLWRLVWVCTVCQCPFYGTLDING